MLYKELHNIFLPSYTTKTTDYNSNPTNLLYMLDTTDNNY
jgi:hypothetical protein